MASLIIYIMEGDNNKDNTEFNNNEVINWNNIVRQEARDIHDADLGKIQGLFEPFIVTEKGTINREKFYIPKSLIARYHEEILYFDLTEQQAKEYCMRTTPPSDDEAKRIVHILTERRRSVKSTGEKENRKKEEATTRAETQIVSVEEEIQRRKKAFKIPLSAPLSKIDLDINEEEIIKKIKTAGNEFRDLILSA